MGRRHKFLLGGFEIFAVCVGMLIPICDWVIPLAEREAGAALGRPVVMRHLRATLARNPVVEADGITIGNPSGFPADAAPLAQIDRLGVTLDGMAWLRNRSIGLLETNLIRPVIEARALPCPAAPTTGSVRAGDMGPAGQTAQQSAGGGRPAGRPAYRAGPRARRRSRLQADFTLDGATLNPPGDALPTERQKQSHIEGAAPGTYAGQPVTARFEGGALLAIRARTNPYPVTLHLENGPSRVDLTGTLLDPTAFGGADLRLDLAGANLALLACLVGVALPDTRQYGLTDRLDHAGRRIRFSDINGRIGGSDVSGTIASDLGAERQQISAELASDRVGLHDPGGLIGANPNVAPPPPGARLPPDTPVTLPRLRFADIDRKYSGKRTEGRFHPLDNLNVALTINNGAFERRPITFRVGRGRIGAEIALTKDVKACAGVGGWRAVIEGTCWIRANCFSTPRRRTSPAPAA